MTAKVKEDLLNILRGEEPAELVFRGGKILDVYNGVWLEEDLAVHQGRILGIGAYEGEKVVDLKGKHVVPGLIDAHVHIESSLMIPQAYAELILAKGTVAIVADPHEIANVYGLEGIDYFLDASQTTDLDIQLMLPSCVPATSVETSGAELTATDLASRMDHPQVMGLGEMMNYPGVIYGEEDVHAKLDLAKAHGKVIDGHISPSSRNDINAYAYHGIMANHECTTEEEARLNLSAGMHLMIREGTAAPNLESLLPAVNDYNRARCMFCTDDRHPDQIEEEGHIDYMVRRAIQLGTDPVQAIQMASLNAASFFDMKDWGGLAPGKKASFIVLSDLESFQIDQVYIEGLALEDRPKKEKNTPLPASVGQGLNFPDLSLEDLALPLKDTQTALGLVEGEIVTKRLEVDRDQAAKLKKLAVIERHKGTGNIGLGLVDGFDFSRGAIGSTIAHDSHNLIVVGDNDEDMLKVIQHIKEMGGGLALCHQGKITASLPLPVAGILSDQAYPQVKAGLLALKKAAADIGYPKGKDPFMTLAFLALPVIPEIRVTDQGIFDVVNFRYLDPA